MLDACRPTRTSYSAPLAPPGHYQGFRPPLLTRICVVWLSAQRRARIADFHGGQGRENGLLESVREAPRFLQLGVMRVQVEFASPRLCCRAQRRASASHSCGLHYQNCKPHLSLDCNSRRHHVKWNGCHGARQSRLGRSADCITEARMPRARKHRFAWPVRR